MGSDLYDVTVMLHREHTKAEAIARALAYGQNFDLAQAFFTEDGPYIETRLLVKSIHPDAPVMWDHIFVLRLLDEMVLYGPGPGGKRYDWQHTPLAEEISGFWEMSPKVKPDDALPILITEVVTSVVRDPKHRRNPMGDTVEIASFVPKRLVPNIAETGSSESRAWSGPTWRQCETYPQTRSARAAHLFPLKREFIEKKIGKANSIALMAPRPEGGIFALGETSLLGVLPDGNVETVCDLSTTPGAYSPFALVVDSGGDIWMGMRGGLFRLRKGESKAERMSENEGIKNVNSLFLTPDGRLIIGAKQGVFIRDTSGTYHHYAAELAHKDTRRAWVTRDGTLWAHAYTGMTRIAQDGKIEKWGKRQGLHFFHEVLPLPNGATWLFESSEPTSRIDEGAPGAVPCPLAAGLAPEGFTHGVLAKNGDVVAVTRQRNLVWLKEGAPPRIFVFENDCGKGKEEVPPYHSQVCVSNEGDVYVTALHGLYRSRAQDIEAAAKASPLNADFPNFAQIKPIQWSATADAEESGKDLVDVEGKNVVLTGTLASMTRADAEKLLASHGAILSDSVTKTTHYLIAGTKAGSKLAKAEKLGIAVLGEDVLRKLGKPPKEAIGKTAKAPVQAPAAPVFPHANEPGSPAGSLDHAMMRSLAESGPAITKKAWQETLKKHKAFLAAGGSGGVFHSLDVSGLVMAVYAGASGGNPEDQANLQRKRLPDGFDAKKALLPYASGCGMIAENVDFSSATLSNGNYTDAFMKGSRFDKANLSHSDFSRADLRGASFQNADLSGADFENANLENADFTGAKLDGSRFPGAKLSGAKR